MRFKENGNFLPIPFVKKSFLNVKKRFLFVKKRQFNKLEFVKKTIPFVKTRVFNEAKIVENYDLGPFFTFSDLLSRRKSSLITA